MPASPHFPNSFYRVSVKGLCVLDGKILLSKESESLSGKWELPGGGLDFGEDPHKGLMREIEEEMGLPVISVSEHPIYAWTIYFENRRGIDWFYSLVLCYRVELGHLNFKPSDECLEIRFFSKEELIDADLFKQSLPLRDHFDPAHF